MTTTPDPAQDDTQNPVAPPSWMLDRIQAEADLARETVKPCPVCGQMPEIMTGSNESTVYGKCACTVNE